MEKSVNEIKYNGSNFKFEAMEIGIEKLKVIHGNLNDTSTEDLIDFKNNILSRLREIEEESKSTLENKVRGLSLNDLMQDLYITILGSIPSNYKKL